MKRSTRAAKTAAVDFVKRVTKGTNMDTNSPMPGSKPRKLKQDLEITSVKRKRAPQQKPQIVKSPNTRGRGRPMLKKNRKKYVTTSKDIQEEEIETNQNHFTAKEISVPHENKSSAGPETTEEKISLKCRLPEVKLPHIYPKAVCVELKSLTDEEITAAISPKPKLSVSAKAPCQELSSEKIESKSSTEAHMLSPPRTKPKITIMSPLKNRERKEKEPFTMESTELSPSAAEKINHKDIQRHTQNKLYSLCMDSSSLSIDLVEPASSPQKTAASIIDRPKLGRPPGKKNRPKPFIPTTSESVDTFTLDSSKPDSEQDIFLITFGLVSKSKLIRDSKPHRLHRAAGGKLRRNLKKKQASGMYYRNFVITRSGAVQVSDDEWSSGEEHAGKGLLKRSGMAFAALKKSKSAPSTPERGSKLGTEASRASPGNAQRKLNFQHLELRLNSGSPPRAMKRKRDWLKPPSRQQDNKNDSLPATKDVKYLVKKSKSFDVRRPASNLLYPMCERTEQRHNDRPQRSNKRKQWGHLLFANPDEYANPSEKSGNIVKATLRKKIKKEKVEPITKPPPVQKSPVKPLYKLSAEDELALQSRFMSAQPKEEKPKKKRKKKQTLEAGASDAGKSPSAKAKLKSSLIGKKKDKLSKSPACKMEKMDWEVEESIRKTMENHTISYLDDSGNIVVDYRQSPDDSQVIMIIGSDGLALSKSEHAIVFKQIGPTLKRMLNDPDICAESDLVSLSLPGRFTSLSEEERRLSNSNGLPQSLLKSPSYYKYRDEECTTPHMCNVCWINDHMYCRNMRRIARNLPPFGGCIHYVPCHHFRNFKEYQKKEAFSLKASRLSTIENKATSSMVISGGRILPGECSRQGVSEIKETTDVTHTNEFDSGSTSMTISGGRIYHNHLSESISAETEDSIKTPKCRSRPRTKSVGERVGLDDSPPRYPENGKDLICEEILLESDSEPNSPETPSELKVQLKARARHIAKSLGFQDEDSMRTPIAIQKALSTSFELVEDVKEIAEVFDNEVIVQEHGCEVEIGESQDEKEVVVGDMHPLNTYVPKWVKQKNNREQPGDTFQEPIQGVRLVPVASRHELSEYVHIKGKEHRLLKLKLIEVKRATQDEVCEEEEYRTDPLLPLVEKTDDFVEDVKPVVEGQTDIELRIETNQITRKTRATAEQSSQPTSDSDHQVTLISPDDTKKKEHQGNPPVVWMSGGDFGFGFKGRSLLKTGNDDSKSGQPDDEAIVKEPDSKAESDILQEGLDMTTECRNVSATPRIRIKSWDSNLPDKLQNKVVPRKDGSQVLAFSTKDIRERKQELMMYIKQANLSTAIEETLLMEKKRLEHNLIEEQLLADDMEIILEEKKCLLAAVESEIKEVDSEINQGKIQLEDATKEVNEAMLRHYELTKRLAKCCGADENPTVIQADCVSPTILQPTDSEASTVDGTVLAPLINNDLRDRLESLQPSNSGGRSCEVNSEELTASQEDLFMQELPSSQPADSQQSLSDLQRPPDTDGEHPFDILIQAANEAAITNQGSTVNLNMPSSDDLVVNTNVAQSSSSSVQSFSNHEHMDVNISDHPESISQVKRDTDCNMNPSNQQLITSHNLELRTSSSQLYVQSEQSDKDIVYQTGPLLTVTHQALSDSEHMQVLAKTDESSSYNLEPDINSQIQNNYKSLPLL